MINKNLINESGLVSGHEIFDVNERVFAAILLQALKRLVDEIAEIEIVLLTIVDGVVDVD